MTYTDFGTIHKTDTRTASKANEIQKQYHRDKHFMLNGYETIIWQKIRKFFWQGIPNIHQIKMLETFETSEMVKYQNGHYLAVRHIVAPIPALFAFGMGQNLVFLDNLGIFFAKIICQTEYFCNFVYGK